MRFRTIWSLRGLPLKERLSRTRDWAAAEIGHRLPLRIRFWVTMQEIGYATRNSPEIPATKLQDILRDLRTPKHMS